jgi:hypothetical protein
MASRSKWLYGCGTGCAVLAAVAILIVALLAFWARNMVGRFEAVDEARVALESEFGREGEFVPWLDGAIPPDRMESFLAIREATAPARERIVAFIEMVPDTEEEARRLETAPVLEKLKFGVSAGRAGFGMAGDLAQFYELRNRTMLERDMSLGEYTYIYATAYYAWLGHSPSEEGRPPPTVTVVEDGERRVLAPEEIEPHLREHLPDSPIDHDVLAETVIRGASGRWQTPRARRAYLDQLRNLVEALDARPEAAVADGWRTRVEDELRRLEEDRRRIPWQDGLPDAIRVSLEPYRAVLEQTYSPAANPFELGRTVKRGWSVHSD